MRTGKLRVVLALGVTLAATVAFAKPKKKLEYAHEHGHGKMSFAVDGKQLSVLLEIPCESIVGFESIPKTAAEKQTVAVAMKKFRQEPASLFGLPTDLGCKATKASVKSRLENDAPHPGTHTDVDGEYTFECTKSPAGATLKLGMFTVFPRLEELDVQVVTADAQRAVKATAKNPEIKL